LRIRRKKIAVGTLVVAVSLLVGMFGFHGGTDTAEADLVPPGNPGSMVALPSAIPGTLPAIAPASGPGSMAIVNVACDSPLNCAADDAGNRALTFTLTRVFPDDGSDPKATFGASGGDTVKCTDGATCDLNKVGVDAVADSDIDGDGVKEDAAIVAVAVGGGGVNEVVKVTACDNAGSCQSARIIFTQTIFAVNPTAHASGAEASLVSYSCGTNIGSMSAAGTDGTANTIDDLSLGNLAQWQLNTDGNLDADYGDAVDNLIFDADGDGGATAATAGDSGPLGTLYVCGGDTSTPADNRVTFETDVGILTVEAFAAAATPPPGTDAACDAGDSVDVVDGTGGQPDPAFAAVGNWCDLDWADNGVVTYGLRGTGTAGVATTSAQQSGGIGPLRSINVTLAGEPASVAGLNLDISGPAALGLTGGEFTMLVTDSEGRPIEGETVECSVDPTSAVLTFLAQTPTSDADGEVIFELIPTGSAVLAGTEMTLSCFLDSNPDVKASATVGTSLEPETETLDLVSGCNFVSWTGADATPAADVAAGASPADALAGIWAQQPAPEWKGFNPEFPEVSDMGPVNQLDVVAVCMKEAGTFTRPAL
jgi:hypothetical protein